MKAFEVKFEVYGKKLKVTVQAETKQHAKKMIKQDIIYHSVEEVEPVSDPDFLGDKTTFYNLMNIFHHSKP